jgi:hypothetical protein
MRLARFSQVLHGDSAAMPVSRSSWSAMNVFVSPDRSSVMCTAWQSKIEARGRESDFQHPSGKPLTPEQRRLPLLQVPHDSLPCPLFTSQCAALLSTREMCRLPQTWNPQAMEQAVGNSSADGSADAKSKSKGTAQGTKGTLAEELIISRAWFDRPVVTIQKAQGERNLWVIGSYSLPGVPLLENAARSGMNVAETLRPGALRPWRQGMQAEQEVDALTKAAAGGSRPGYLKPGNCVIGARTFRSSAFCVHQRLYRAPA